MKDTEILAAIKKFNQLLMRYPDSKESSFYFTNFLKQFLRVKSTASEICLVSFVTIIEHEKPEVFYEIRKRGEYDNVMNFIIHLTTDYEKAKSDLNKLANGSREIVIVQ
ncbi:hypothetical protein [Metabacillus litoralis]|uniref:hypothetical protein n=1 Tax=Metabacillus litoralis TaxID=152268 RepID=UPI00203F18A4|nr:hypothetical protein [Metabacillus litoralis]MCM3409716.1 hypothetical protein [Metabacillus litoralis]